MHPRLILSLRWAILTSRIRLFAIILLFIVFFLVIVLMVVGCVVDLTSNFVLLAVKNEVTLSQRTGHSTDFLFTIPVVLSTYVGLNKVILILYQDFEFPLVRILLWAVKLDIIRIFESPFFILLLLHLIA